MEILRRGVATAQKKKAASELTDTPSFFKD